MLGKKKDNPLLDYQVCNFFLCKKKGIFVKQMKEQTFNHNGINNISFFFFFLVHKRMPIRLYQFKIKSVWIFIK